MWTQISISNGLFESALVHDASNSKANIWRHRFSLKGPWCIILQTRKQMLESKGSIWECPCARHFETGKLMFESKYSIWKHSCAQHFKCESKYSTANIQLESTRVNAASNVKAICVNTSSVWQRLGARHLKLESKYLKANSQFESALVHDASNSKANIWKQMFNLRALLCKTPNWKVNIQSKFSIWKHQCA
jgi:hypothetical protein